jgi:DNA-binding HxlR family transcriptional regulator
VVDSRCSQRDHDPEALGTCSEVLSRIGDKWSLLIIATLGEGDLRFNELRRAIGTISQKMLASTLKVLERDGFVERSVTPTVPPQVSYGLSEFGRELLPQASALARWAGNNAARIRAARTAYDTRNQATG